MSVSVVKLANGTLLIDKIMEVKTAETEDGGIMNLASTESVDSDGDIIFQGKNEHGDGWNLERFNKHPVMLWGHNIYVPSLGKGHAFVGETDLGKGLHFVPAFDKEDDFARQIEGKVRRGVLSETSVGFSSNNYDRRKSDDGGGFEFYDSELVEISWVNRGANPDVNSMVKSMLKDNPGLLRELETFDDPVLKALKEEFVDKLEELNARMRSLEEGIMSMKDEEVNRMAAECVKAFKDFDLG